jgi:hypothetical protein
MLAVLEFILATVRAATLAHHAVAHHALVHRCIWVSLNFGFYVTAISGGSETLQILLT